jgi:hypothetical protein
MYDLVSWHTSEPNLGAGQPRIYLCRSFDCRRVLCQSPWAKVGPVFQAPTLLTSYLISKIRFFGNSELREVYIPMNIRAKGCI